MSNLIPVIFRLFCAFYALSKLAVWWILRSYKNKRILQCIISSKHHIVSSLKISRLVLGLFEQRTCVRGRCVVPSLGFLGSAKHHGRRHLRCHVCVSKCIILYISILILGKIVTVQAPEISGCSFAHKSQVDPFRRDGHG